MIIHCTTIEQIKDVIATERIKFYTPPRAMLEECKDKLCINTKGGYGNFNTFIGDIISYSEWKSGKKIQLPINKDHKSEKGIVVYFNSPDETIVKLVSEKADVLTTINIGKWGASINIANEIIKLFNLPYELIDKIKTDWSTIQVGTKLTFTKDSMCSYKMIVIFHSYIPQTNQIIVLNGNKVEVYQESEVSPCN